MGPVAGIVGGLRSFGRPARQSGRCPLRKNIGQQLPVMFGVEIMTRPLLMLGFDSTVFFSAFPGAALEQRRVARPPKVADASPAPVIAGAVGAARSGATLLAVTDLPFDAIFPAAGG